jgi:menaquinol-cytochrome c reductase iron-sulfur subunit
MEENSKLTSLSEGKVDRRTFLQTTGKGVLGTLLVGYGIPLVLAGCSSATQNKKVSIKSLVELGELDKILKQPLPAKIDYRTTFKDGWVERELKGFVYVNRNQNGDLLVMSPTCTHLGCSVPQGSLEEKEKGISFHCPCHDGLYDDMGINIGGPPPRPLDVFQPYIIDGKLYINVFKPVKRT